MLDAARRRSGTRRAHELFDAHPRLAVTAIQAVGVKGHDGFLMALVTDPGMAP